MHTIPLDTPELIELFKHTCCYDIHAFYPILKECGHSKTCILVGDTGRFTIVHAGYRLDDSRFSTLPFEASLELLPRCEAQEEGHSGHSEKEKEIEEDPINQQVLIVNADTCRLKHTLKANSSKSRSTPREENSVPTQHTPAGLVRIVVTSSFFLNS